MTSLGVSHGQQAVVKTWEGKRERHISARLNYQLARLGAGSNQNVAGKESCCHTGLSSLPEDKTNAEEELEECC